MPWTLYRHILKDLLRLLLLATGALVTVIGFAVAIKPMVDGLLSPALLPRYVFYMTPLVVVLVLPFAAAFASTMVFIRMTNDNEVVACRAGGMSYQVILLPVILLGMVLMGGVYWLSNYVVPRFYRSAERLVQQDLTRMVVAQVSAGQPVQLLDDVVLYADRADDSHPPPVIPGSSVQPQRLIVLEGAALGQLDKRGRVQVDHSAQRAEALVWNVEGRTWLTLRLDQATRFDPVNNELMGFATLEFPPILVPDPFQEEAMFFSLDQLRELADHPEAYPSVQAERRDLIAAIGQHELLRQVHDALADEAARRTASFIGPTGDTYRLRAPRVELLGQTLALRAGPDGAPVRLDRVSGGIITRRIEAQSGEVEIISGEPDPEPRVALSFTDAREYDPRLPTGGAEHRQATLPPLRWPQPVVADVGQQNTFALLKQAEAMQEPGSPVVEAVLSLRRAIEKLGRRTIAQFHSRAATAVVCLLVIVLGATLSMQLQGGLPLVVFLASFLLAILAVIIIRTGDNFAVDERHQVTFGLTVMWTGNLLLALVLLGALWRLRRT